MVAAMALDPVVTPAASAVAPAVGFAQAEGCEHTRAAAVEAGRTRGL